MGSQLSDSGIINSLRLPNGVRYPLVGGTRQPWFDGTNFKPRKLLENAQTPTSRVHAVLGSFTLSKENMFHKSQFILSNDLTIEYQRC